MSRESNYYYEVSFEPRPAVARVSNSGVSALTRAAIPTVVAATSRAIERFEESLRASTLRRLPGEDATKTSTLLALANNPALLQEARAVADRTVNEALNHAEHEPDPVLLLARITGDPDLHHALKRVDAVIEAAIERLVTREHEWLRGTIESSLLDMGYETVPGPGHGSGRATLELRARHPNGTVIALAADSRRGSLTVDLEGFSDGSCLKARRQLESALKRCDVSLRLIADSPHGKTGGSLARRLAGNAGAPSQACTTDGARPNRAKTGGARKRQRC